MWLVGPTPRHHAGPHGSCDTTNREWGLLPWPEPGTHTWPSVGTFSWPRTSADIGITSHPALWLRTIVTRSASAVTCESGRCVQSSQTRSLGPQGDRQG